MTPQRLLVVAVVLLAGLAAAFYFLLAEDAAGGAPVAALGGPGKPTRTTLVEEAGEAARLSTVETQEAARAVRDEVAGSSVAPAREIEVVVTSPPGAPADPGLSVVVVEASALEEDSPPEVLLRLREERGSGSAIARAAVGADGRARLGLPAGIEEPQLLLDGRFLFVTEPRPLESDETTVQLTPRLGACLVVRPVAPGGDAPVGKITLTGGDMSGRGGGNWFAVGQEFDGGELVYGGLDADNTWFLSGKLERHFTWGRMGLELEAGLEQVVDLELLPGASVAGVVVDTAGEPVADVTVRPEMGAANWMGGGGNRPEATTDDEGAFELFALSPGEKVLEAQIDGWRPAKSDEFELAEGQHLDGLSLVLERGESLAGVVVFPDGVAAEGATVTVESVTQRQGWGGFGGTRRRKAGSATCDEAGRFAVTGLAEGKVSLSASATAPGADPDDEDAPLWYASLDDVAAGSQGLTLTLAGPEAFTGRVVDDLGEPVTAFRIEAESSEGDDPGGKQSFENDEGRFTFARVGPGTWTVEVSAEGHVQEEAPEVTLPGAAELEVVLLRAARVSGRVLGASGGPVAGARVMADEGGGGGANPWMRMRGPRAETDSEGAFEFEELSPGALSFVAQADGWADSESVGIEVGPGEELEDVVLTLRVGGRIEGVVSTPEGEPMAGQRVTWGENSMGFGSRDETRADGAGRFAFDAVTPGEWAVSAVPSMEEMGERMRGGRDQGAWIEMMGQIVTETVDVGDGELVEVFLGGEPRRPVSVVGVVTQAGEAVAGARVFAVSEGSAIFQGMKTTETAGDGTYELVVDRPGPYVISAQMDRAGIEQLVDVPRADETRVDLPIPIGGIEGRVKLASGEPADGVRISVQREDGMGRVRWAGGQATTDSDGNYSIESLEEGIYTVRANVSGWGGGADQDWGSATLPGVKVREDALSSGVDFRLESAGSVTGIVTGADGTPLADAGVFFRDATGRLVTAVSSTTTGASGRFSQDGLAPGEYTISVRAEGQAANDVETVRVLSDEETEVRLSVETGVMALVQLEDPEGNASRLRVEVFDRDDREVGGLITAAQLRSLFNRGSSTFEQRVGPLPPGRYTVRATTPEGEVVEKRVTLRARDEEKVVRLVLD